MKMKKFKKMLGYLIISQIGVLLLLCFSVEGIIELGFMNTLGICEGIVLICAIILFIGNKAIDWIV